ncbi:MAG: hypothetical protein CVV22_02380 [Ignavibacteriae bacterium HGW-Ignavibacteriae-1]|jgi:YbgC/YbaW family acyl-CoA thioester hydrolase|nr:MAG: hypothetical protein CVV22_02380 [Ignavibacteriae bacterium HGW-Ignavibacteriae-1]
MSDRITEQDILKDMDKYKHTTNAQVKFHEVDSFGVVHNIQYFYFLEWARTKYFEFIGMPLNHRTYTAENPIMTVRHVMDYFNPLYFTDYYDVLTRTKTIGNSSIVMENVIRMNSGKIAIKAEVTLVYMSDTDYRPTRLPDYMRNAIMMVEGDDLEIIESEPK